MSKYVSEDTLNATQNVPSAFKDRDGYEKKIHDLETEMISAADLQLQKSKDSREEDEEWVDEYNQFVRLEKELNERRKIRDGYLESLEYEKIKYNKEYNYTKYITVMNTLLAGGAIYMWFA